MAPLTSIASRASQRLSLDGFANPGVPEKLRRLDLTPPAERQYILRMAIRAEGGAYLIPNELEWLKPLFFAALAHQDSLGVDHPFCYFTVRHGLVDSATDDEWHVDGFSMKVPHGPEQNYVWCSHTGTEYAALQAAFPADFDPLRHNVNHFLAGLVDNEIVGACDAQTVYCMDPFLLHRRPAATAGIQRTFVRLSFVPIEIDDTNNTQNPLLPRSYSADGVAFRNRLATYQAA